MKITAPLVRAISVLAVGAAVLATPARATADLAEPLPQVLEESAPDAFVPVILVLDRQVAPSEIRALVAAHPDKRERRAAIAERLKRDARLGQAPILAWLDGERDAVRNVRPLWLTSVIGVEATPALVRRLASVQGIAEIRHNPKRDVFLERPAPSALAPDPGTTDLGTLDAGIAEIECGVDQLRAPQVWNELGFSGTGAVVAVIDSGVCWSHPDIVNQVWVNPGEDLDHDGVVMDADDQNGVDDDGNGFVDDLIGWNFEFGTNQPGDDNSHGSHCAGSVAGDGASGTQAGMAPDAGIMVLRVGLSTSDEVDVWNAMQYAAENGADAITMSLGWQHSWNPARATWRANCENTIDMGTAMVIAAGNEGSGNEPDNVRTPGDVPRVISVAAIDCSSAIASFSSRGPVTWQDVPEYGDHPYPPGLIKPDVSGPGVNTKSHNVCGGYSFKSGTSMATPHVAGAVALMIGANPSITHDEIKQALMDTAVDLGDPGKDNVYGMGRVDAYEAVRAVASALRYETHVVDESDPNHGNGDGNLDIDEVATVRVTLRNAGADPVTGIHARLTTTDPNVEILDGTAYWPDLAPGTTAESSSPHFTVRFRQGCGVLASFRLEMFGDGLEPSFGGFVVRAGERRNETFFQDDLEADSGWTVSGTEVDNPFVREDPRGVTSGGVEIQPEDDTTPTGTLCWVTGNPRTNGNFNPGDGDVDALTEVTSPVFDADAGDEVVVDLSRWVHISQLNLGETSHYAMLVSNDGGANWTEVDRLSTHPGAWDAVSIPISVGATGQMRLRFRASQEGGIGGFGDTLIEVAIDDRRRRDPGRAPGGRERDPLRLGRVARGRGSRRRAVLPPAPVAPGDRRVRGGARLDVDLRGRVRRRSHRRAVVLPGQRLERRRHLGGRTGAVSARDDRFDPE